MLNSVEELVDEIKRRIEEGREAERALKIIEHFLGPADPLVNHEPPAEGAESSPPPAGQAETKRERAKRKGR